MKKIGILFITILLIVSGFQAIGAGKSRFEAKETVNYETTFGPIFLEEKEGYLYIDCKGTTEYIDVPGDPQLPVFQKVFKISNEVKITEIECLFPQTTNQKISKKVLPTLQPIYNIISLKEPNMPQLIENKEIYNTDMFYPTNLYDYYIKCGLDVDGTPTTFIIVEIHPVRYNPIKNLLSYISEVNIHIEYEKTDGKSVESSVDTYDLVIIAPETFVDDLQPLITHKNSMGLSTILKTTDEIYAEYEGRDKPEQIKYFIKDAKENWDTSYILLVGGLKSYLYNKDKDDQNQGSSAWHVPVRYTNIQEGDEKGCISDLYYSDLYKYDEETQSWEFEDWDSNGDGIFAKWSMLIGKKDDLDLAPDIYVGRLPCRNKFELKIIRDKIINYESSSPDEKPWYRKMIGITGKNFAMWEGQPDGEYLVDRAIENMSSRVDEVVRVYASNNLAGEGPIPNNEDIVNEFSKGAGFIDFEGHGNPTSWNTIHADGEYENHDWVGGIQIDDFLKLSNGDKLPVVMVGGCHNALFNVSILRILLTRNEHYNWYWTWTPTPLCFCWAMVVKPGGGAIASIGATGLGPASGNDPISLLGEIDNDFFYVIGQEHVEKLGEGHSGAIVKYVTDNVMRQRETFTATVTQLFGDPSLQLGGYP